MEGIVTKHEDAKGLRREEDFFASADKATANIDYIAMMEDLDLDGDDEEAEEGEEGE